MAQTEENIKVGVSLVWVPRGILGKLATFLLDVIEAVTTEGKTAGKKDNVFLEQKGENK